MNLFRNVMCLCGLFLGAGAANGASPVDSARTYFSEKLVGKQFVLASSGLMANDTISYDFKRTRSYGPLELTDGGFRYRYSWNIEQVNFDVVDGERVGEGYVKNRLGVSECSVVNSKSVDGLLFGHCRVLFNSLTDSSAAVTRVRLTLTEKGMETTEISLSDCFASGNTYFLCESETVSHFQPVADGKIKIVEDWKSYRLDPESMRRDSDQPNAQSTDENIQQ